MKVQIIKFDILKKETSLQEVAALSFGHSEDADDAASAAPGDEEAATTIFCLSSCLEAIRLKFLIKTRDDGVWG